MSGIPEINLRKVFLLAALASALLVWALDTAYRRMDSYINAPVERVFEVEHVEEAPAWAPEDVFDWSTLWR